MTLRGLIIAILALGLWTHAGADGDNGGVSAKFSSMVPGADETSATRYICCHRKNDHNACRLRGLHFNSESLVSRASEFDPSPNVVLHNNWDVASCSLYDPLYVGVAGSNKSPHEGSIYLTTLRLRL